MIMNLPMLLQKVFVAAGVTVFLMVCGTATPLALTTSLSGGINFLCIKLLKMISVI